MQDPDKVLLPRSNFVLITFGEDESVDRIPFALPDDLPLDLCQGSAIEKFRERNCFGGCYRSGSRSQLSNRFEDGLIELIQLSSLQFPVEYLAYIATSPPKVNVLLIVRHRVLDRCDTEVCSKSKRSDRTRIIVRRTAADPRAT